MSIISKKFIDDKSLVSAKEYGAKGDGTYITGVSIGLGSHTFTHSGFTSSDIGKLIFIDGAGTSSGTLVSLITNVSGTTITINDAATTAVTDVRGFYGTDDYVAIASAISAVAPGGGTVYFPVGTYATSQTITITSPGVKLKGDGTSYSNGYLDPAILTPGSEIRFLGIGEAIFFDGGGTPAVYDTQLLKVGISDLSIAGTSHTTICLRLRSIHHSEFKNYSTADCSSAGTKTEFSVCNIYRNPIHSVNVHRPLSGALPTYGMWLTQRGTGETSTASIVEHMIFEGVGTGLLLESTQEITVVGGTCEGCEIGIEIGGAYNGIFCTINNVDLESNTSADVQVHSGSFGNIFNNLVAGSSSLGGGITFETGSYYCTVNGGEYSNITIESGVPLITLLNVMYFTSYVNNGPSTRNFGTWDGYSGVYDPINIVQGMNISGSLRGIGNTLTLGANGNDLAQIDQLLTFYSRLTSLSDGGWIIDSNSGPIWALRNADAGFLAADSITFRSKDDNNYATFAADISNNTTFSTDGNFYITTYGFVITTALDNFDRFFIDGYGNISWGAAQPEQLNIAHPVTPGIGANDGADTVIKAQPGQNQTIGFDNNNGGNFIIESGAPGTGGDGAAGADGEIQFIVGSSGHLLSITHYPGIPNIAYITTGADATYIFLNASTDISFLAPVVQSAGIFQVVDNHGGAVFQLSNDYATLAKMTIGSASTGFEFQILTSGGGTAPTTRVYRDVIEFGAVIGDIIRIHSANLPAECVIFAKATIRGMTVGSTDSSTWLIRRAFSRTGSGSWSQSTPNVDGPYDVDSGVADPTVSLESSSGDLRVVVGSSDPATVDWDAVLTLEISYDDIP